MAEEWVIGSMGQSERIVLKGAKLIQKLSSTFSYFDKTFQNATLFKKPCLPNPKNKPKFSPSSEDTCA